MDFTPSNDHKQAEVSLLQGRRLGVIVLTDNRQASSSQKSQSKDFRGSGYKDTEVDPLEFQNRDTNSIENLALLAELTRRVTHLQERVEALRNAEIEQNHKEANALRPPKKNRRKFDELVRNFQCEVCLKKYGSETALKNHVKIKHGKVFRDDDNSC